MSKNVKKLAVLAKGLGLSFTEPLQIHRTYAGYWQKSAGAWSWYVVDADGREIMGSMDSVRMILAAKTAGVQPTTFATQASAPELYVDNA